MGLQVLLKEQLAKYAGQADFLEVRVEDSEELKIDVKKGKVDSISPNLIYGGNVRALINGGWGFVVFKNLSELDLSIRRAIEHAQAVGHGKSHWAPVSPVNHVSKLKFINDPRDVPLDTKVDLLKRYTSIIDNYHKEIVASSGYYEEKFMTVYYANSEGTYLEQEKIDNYLRVSATAVRGNDTQSAFLTVGGGLDFARFNNQEGKVKEKCQLALDLLDAPRIKGGHYTVILNPDLAGVFVHEAFGHTVEADFAADNPALQKVLKTGETFAPEFVNIYDSGIIPGLRGSYDYDDEGTPAEKTYLLRNGKFVGFMHSRETAAKMNSKPTGNARAYSYQYPPIVRMRNTSIEAGSASFDEMIQDIELGVYAVDARGGKGGENFSFTASHGYMIRNGKIAELVKGFTLAGNLFKTLRNIEMVGNDEVIKNGGGGCGKGEQFPLPVTDGGPHVRIKNVVIGGEA